MLTTRLRAVTVGAAIAIIAVAAPGASAGAAASSACTATSGVTVVVDFSHFAGRGIERGCAPGHPATGLAALHAAGFSTAGTAQYGDAFVCRIDGLPSAKHEACAQTPPGNASWSFYSAKATDTKWTYNNVGVLSYQPASGSIEAFAFGDFAKPGITPSAALPPPTTTTPPTHPSTTTVPAPLVSAAIAATTTTTTAPTTTAVSSTSTSPSSGGPSTTGVVATTTSPSRTSATVLFVQRARRAPLPRNHSGSPLPAILTIVVVGALAIGAAAYSRSRRRPA